jgi:hypothetical protein
MAIDSGKLADDLEALYESMDAEPVDTRTFAENMAEILVKHIKTAAVPAGKVIVSVAGQATGTPNAAEIPVS